MREGTDMAYFKVLSQHSVEGLRKTAGSQSLGWDPQIWRNGNLLTMTFGVVPDMCTVRGSSMFCISPCHVDQLQLVLLPTYFSWPQGFYLQAPLTQRMWWDGRQISESGGVQSGQVQEPRHCAAATCPQAVPLCVQNYPVSEAKSKMVRISTSFTKCLSHCKMRVKILSKVNFCLSIKS